MFPRIDTMAYGASQDQVGDLYLPEAEQPPVICLLHGGYWRMPWGRDHIAPLAVPLTQLGFAVWNLEYRRVRAAAESGAGGGRSGGGGRDGGRDGGWPGTLQDVGAGIDCLATWERRLDLDRVTVVGHSAGGHLALWAAAQGGEHGNGFGFRPTRVRVAAAVGLAPVVDLVWAYEHGCGNGAVENFLGGSPGEYPGRYREASPAARLPLGVRQLILHGTPDEDVPVEISRRYAQAAVAAGDDLTFMELPDVSHMDLVDPASPSTAILFDWLATSSGL
jgi:acetyl esterase/lipase